MVLSRRDALRLGAGCGAFVLTSAVASLFRSGLAYADDVRVSVTAQNAGVFYGDDQQSGYFRISHDGANYTGFCATSWEPRQVPYGANEVAYEADGSLKNGGYAIDSDLLRRALYFSPGISGTPDGPGYDPAIWAEVTSMPGASSLDAKQRAYVCAHVLVTYAVWRARLMGHNGWSEDRMRQGVVNRSIVGDAFWRWFDANVFDTIMPRLRAQSIPDTFVAYAIFPGHDTSPALEGSGNQVVVWGEGSSAYVTAAKAPTA